MKLLFQIQKKVQYPYSNLMNSILHLPLWFSCLFLIAKIDDLRANYSGSTVSLADICLKPLGTECATQSVLQVMK